MKYKAQNIRKLIIGLLLVFFTFETGISYSQNFSETKEHKRLWRRWSKRESRNKRAFNPNINPNTNKTKGLASKELAADNKRVERQQKREIRRQKRKLRRTKGAYKKANG